MAKKLREINENAEQVRKIELMRKIDYQGEILIIIFDLSGW